MRIPSVCVGRDRWTRAALQSEGFVGWVPWSGCPAALKIDSAAGGVYVVLREALDEPAFLTASPAGTFRGDPSVPPATLIENWVPGASVLYIGKGDHGRLVRRLAEFVDFGRGGKQRHWGGRLIWQLDDAGSLLVGWRILARDEGPVDVEAAMLDDFRASYGKPPYANRPHLHGK